MAQILSDLFAYLHRSLMLSEKHAEWKRKYGLGLWLSSVIVCAIAPVTLLTDQVTMKNGNRLTGAIQKSEAKTLTLKSDYAGVLALPWAAIASVKSDKPLNVALLETKQEVPVAEVTAIRDADEQKAWERLQHPGWLELWNGTINLGAAGTSGNSET
jgi:hypothetical protein